MAANSSYEVELQALRGELGELRGILAIPEVRDALKSVRKGKKKEEEVVVGPMLPPSREENQSEDEEQEETPRRKAERLTRTYATPEYRRVESNKERNLRKRRRSRHGREGCPRRSHRYQCEDSTSSSSSRERSLELFLSLDNLMLLSQKKTSQRSPSFVMWACTLRVWQAIGGSRRSWKERNQGVGLNSSPNSLSNSFLHTLRRMCDKNGIGSSNKREKASRPTWMSFGPPS